MDDVNATERWSTEDLWLISAGKVAVLTMFKHFAGLTPGDKWPITSKVNCNFPSWKACAQAVSMPFFVMGEGKSLRKCSSFFCSQWQFVLAVLSIHFASFFGDYLCSCSSNLTSEEMSRPNLWYVRQHDTLHKLTEDALTLWTDLKKWFRIIQFFWCMANVLDSESVACCQDMFLTKNNLLPTTFLLLSTNIAALWHQVTLQSGWVCCKNSGWLVFWGG